MLEIFAILLSLTHPLQAARPAWPLPRASSFDPGERAISNWRVQAALDLDLGADIALRWLAGNAPANLPRCIRLNNYWCIKKAGWTGEIDADPEGHAAFASAGRGAEAAIVLLRRYYLDYGRKSARAIVAHWAPAQCELSAPATGTNIQAPVNSLGPLAKYGLRHTLRARWLAAHPRGFVARRGARKLALRRSVVPDRLAPTTPEPPLVLEPPIRTETLRAASISPAPLSRNTSLVPPPPPTMTSCTGDSARLTNYAMRAIEGIAGSPDADLKLFDSDGSARPGLQRLLANMAAVEIGPYRADANLIDAAIEAVGNERLRSQASR